jgi:hypothetical protein
MSAVGDMPATKEQTDVPGIIRGSLKLGLAQSALVLLFSLISRFLDGPIEIFLEAIVLLIGLSAVIALPGLWTRAVSVDGVASAAGIGLGATIVYLLVDVALLQPIGAYTNRWYEIGGGSNWWYHPIWWMAGTYLSWLGAWILANQTSKSGAPSVAGLLGSTAVFTVLAAAAGVILHVPGAAWTLPTFAIAVLPGLSLAAVVSVLASRRG